MTLLEQVKALIGVISGRKVAYQRSFDLNTIYGHTVLMDLARFCRAHDSTFSPDSRTHALLEGRREVWLRIQEHLQMTPEQIYALHPVKEIKPQALNGVSATQLNKGV